MYCVQVKLTGSKLQRCKDISIATVIKSPRVTGFVQGVPRSAGVRRLNYSVNCCSEAKTVRKYRKVVPRVLLKKEHRKKKK